MDVHTPKRPIHGWRAFLGEVGIIVLGVLIALGAEQTVQALEWRHKVAEAEDALRIELLEDDGPQAYVRAAIAPCLKTEIAVVRASLEQRVDRARLHAVIDAYAPPARTWDSEAWKAVLASDVGTHMGAKRLISWSLAYRVVPLMLSAAVEERAKLTELRTFRRTPGLLTDVEIDRLLPIANDLSRLNGDLSNWSLGVLWGMGQDGVFLRKDQTEPLLARARARYGSCVATPDPRTFGSANDDQIGARGHP